MLVGNSNPETTSSDFSLGSLIIIDLVSVSFSSDDAAFTSGIKALSKFTRIFAVIIDNIKNTISFFLINFTKIR